MIPRGGESTEDPEARNHGSECEADGEQHPTIILPKLPESRRLRKNIDRIRSTISHIGQNCQHEQKQQEIG